MNTRFEFNNKMLSVKADNEFLYLYVNEEKLMVKIAFEDIKKTVKYVNSIIRNTKLID